MTAAQFHVSSDYLAENKPSYEITDWQDGFEIQLYNYEKENTALISENDIEYEVKLSDTGKWQSDVQSGTITGSSEQQSQSIKITPLPLAGENDSVTVTVSVVAPFTKTLSATFTACGKNQPDYSIQDQKDGTVLVTIHSNACSDTVTINWDTDKYAPDNTNSQMENWQSSPQTFSVQKNTTYEWLFFKKTTDSISDGSGSGTTIQLS